MEQSNILAEIIPKSRDDTTAISVYRTIPKKVFEEFDVIIMQNLSDILQLSCAPTMPCHYVSENQEVSVHLFEY